MPYFLFYIHHFFIIFCVLSASLSRTDEAGGCQSLPTNCGEEKFSVCACLFQSVRACSYTKYPTCHLPSVLQHATLASVYLIPRRQFEG